MDGFTSLAVLIGAIGTYLGYPIVDPIVGLFITALILHTIWESGHEVSCQAVNELKKHLPHLSHIFIHVVPLHSSQEIHHHDDEGKHPL